MSGHVHVYMCGDIDIASVSTIYRLGFGTIPTIWKIWLFIKTDLPYDWYDLWLKLFLYTLLCVHFVLVKESFD
jgi:hypothetical protein